MSCVELSPEVISAIDSLEAGHHCPSIIQKGTNLEIIVDDALTFRRTLILHSAHSTPEQIILQSTWDGCFYLEKFQKESDHYCLTCYWDAVDTDVSLEITICFTDASVRTECFHAASSAFFWDNPWLALSGMNPDHRYYTLGTACNPSELELIPLLQEISTLFQYPSPSCYPLLKQLLLSHGHSSEAAAVSKLESIGQVHRRFIRVRANLLNRLCKSKFEPLWRDIFAKISASQKGLPSKAETYCSPALLKQTRKKIQQLMEMHGYSGSYPDFSKSCSISGIREVSSYGKSYLVSSERRVRCYIHCKEHFFGLDQLQISFLCGTAFLKKDEPESDIYSCLFNANGRRLFSCLRCTPGKPFSPGLLPLEQALSIAVKKTELSRLSKEERQSLGRPNKLNWRGILILFLVCGAFALFFTAAMLLLTVPLAGFAFAFHPLRFIKYFLLTWAAFGGAFTLISIWSARKK